MSVHLGILAGVRTEADCLIPFLPPDLRVTVYLTGARIEQARLYAEKLATDGVTHFLSYGFAGGLDPSYPPGTLLVPRAVVTLDGRRYMVDGEWYERALDVLLELSPVTSMQVGVDEAITDAAAKQELSRRIRGVAGVDMESHLIAEVAEKARRPFIVIRAICDPATESLPPAAMVAVKPDGSTSMTRVLGSVLRRPGQIAALNRLARASQAATKTLLGCGRWGGPTGFGVG